MENSQEKWISGNTVHTAAAALLDRAFLYLEEGKWRKADAYCERALDLEPRCGETYLAKLMIERKVKSRELLAECIKPIEKSPQYEKILRFGDDALKAELNGYIESRKANIGRRLKQRRKKFLIIAASAVACIAIVLLAASLISRAVTGRSLKQAEVGDIVTLGRYEQDNNRLNGKEPVEWLVVEAEGDERVLVSVKGLKARAYHNEFSATTWEGSSVREWLNGQFLKSTFNPIIRPFLCEKEVSADPNPDFDTDPGNATLDTVYLLSGEEAETCLTEEQLICYATERAVNDGADTDEAGACWWYLRTPGLYSDYAMYVGYEGEIYTYGDRVTERKGCIRPVITVRVS